MTKLEGEDYSTLLNELEEGRVTPASIRAIIMHMFSNRQKFNIISDYKQEIAQYLNKWLPSCCPLKKRYVMSSDKK